LSAVYIMSHSADLEVVKPEKEVLGDHVERTTSEDTNEALINEYSELEQKRIIRRIDYRLVSILGIMYCASLMDRTNLSAAAIAGLVYMSHAWIYTTKTLILIRAE
jgi:hypothetical protein